MRLDVHPFKDAEAAREWARNQIDQAAGIARARYITVTPGQDATYQAKYADAQAFARAGYPDASIADYPWVKAEADATSSTYTDAANGIKQVGDPWNMQIGPSIEGARIGGKDKLHGLATIPEIVSHAAQVVAQLAKI